jgi:hypothetical protein
MLRIIFFIIIFFLYCLCFGDVAEATGPELPSESDLEELIASTKDELEYWKDQFRVCEAHFKDSIVSNDVNGQKEASQAMKENHDNINFNSKLLKDLNSRL